MSDSLERIYRSVPQVECKGLCHDTCGPIEVTSTERARIAARGVVIPPADSALVNLLDNPGYTCPALVDKRCSVYEDRPLICRFWGAVQSLPCPHGCTVTPGLLMDAGARSLMRRAEKLDEAR